jgi:hypothetical protein
MAGTSPGHDPLRAASLAQYRKDRRNGEAPTPLELNKLYDSITQNRPPFLQRRLGHRNARSLLRHSRIGKATSGRAGAAPGAELLTRG